MRADLGVDDAADARPSFRLQESAAVGDDRHRTAAEAGIGAEHFGRVFGLKLDVIARVEDAQDYVFDLVRQAVIGGQHAVEIGGIARRFVAAPALPTGGVGNWRKRWRMRSRQSASSFAM